MTDYEVGYLQALGDVRLTAQQMVADLGASPGGRVELLGMVSFLFDMIDAKVTRHGDHGTKGASNENVAECNE